VNRDGCRPVGSFPFAIEDRFHIESRVFSSPNLARPAT